MQTVSVDFVCARLAAVVFVVQSAGNLPDGTLLRGDPQVARAGVEDDLESLGRCADFDGSVVERPCSC